MLPSDVTSLKTPALYYRERAFLTELVSQADARHLFGGELSLAITGEPHGSYPLHRIMTIDLTTMASALPIPTSSDRCRWSSACAMRLAR